MVLQPASTSVHGDLLLGLYDALQSGVGYLATLYGTHQLQGWKRGKCHVVKGHHNYSFFFPLIFQSFYCYFYLSLTPPPNPTCTSALFYILLTPSEMIPSTPLFPTPPPPPQHTYTKATRPQSHPLTMSTTPQSN